MIPGERALAVRAIDGMVELAGVDRSNPGVGRERLRRLLDAHRTEWNVFMCSLPKHSWVRDIVAQL